MPQIMNKIPLSLDFLWKSRYMMGKLWPMQRKMFFAPFQIVNPRNKYYDGQIIDVPLTLWQSFIGTSSKGKKILEKARLGYKDIANVLPSEDAFIPYEYVGIKQGTIRFRLKNCHIFWNNADCTTCPFDLREISGYVSGANKDNGAIALLWYFQAIIYRAVYDTEAARADAQMPKFKIIYDANNAPAELHVAISYEELKKVRGYKKYDYTNIPDNKRELFEDMEEYLSLMYKLDNYIGNLSSDTITPYQEQYIASKTMELMEMQDKLESKYHASMKVLKKTHDAIIHNISLRRPLRQPFIDRAITPGLEELKKGNMLHAIAVNAWKRPAKRTKDEMQAGIPIRSATNKEVLVKSNYEMLPPGEYAVKNAIYDGDGNLIGGDIIWDNITDYRHTKVGEEYTICFDLRPQQKKRKPRASSSKASEKPYTVDVAPLVFGEQTSFFDADSEEDIPYM